MLPAFFQAIGTDRYLSIDELRAAVGEHPQTTNAWSLYRTSFDGFCETRLDPQCHRLEHPARTAAQLESMRGEPVIVFGTGPSAYTALETLARVRDSVRVFTSPRGAELLAAHGLVPDLVLVEHRTALDAHHSTRHLRDAGVDPLRLAPLVVAEWRTPRALIAGVPPDRLFVPDLFPTWGLWPVTAVALAGQAGAARIGLLGIDLGTVRHADPAFAPLARLLGLLSDLIAADTLDCGASGSRKHGWTVEPLDAMVAAGPLGRLKVHRTAAPSIDERISDMRERLGHVSAIVERARDFLALGLRARAGEGVSGLDSAASEMLSWSADVNVRISLQESFGLSFLPRLWRTGVDLTLGRSLWRPVVLAAHELVGQAQRLDSLTKRMAA